MVKIRPLIEYWSSQEIIELTDEEFEELEGLKFPEDVDFLEERMVFHSKEAVVADYKVVKDK